MDRQSVGVSCDDVRMCVTWTNLNAVVSVSLLLLTLVGNSMSNAIIKNDSRRSHGPIAPPPIQTPKAVLLAP